MEEAVTNTCGWSWNLAQNATTNTQRASRRAFVGVDGGTEFKASLMVVAVVMAW